MATRLKRRLCFTATVAQINLDNDIVLQQQVKKSMQQEKLLQEFYHVLRKRWLTMKTRHCIKLFK